MAHTPGPWRYAKKRVYASVDGETALVADVAALHGPCTMQDQQNRAKERRENGILIAAAPELLTACELAANILYLLADEVAALGHNASNVRAIVRDAITKAKGESA